MYYCLKFDYIRKGMGTKDTLHSWDQVKAVSRKVRNYARMYRRARSAMIRLGAEKPILDEYKVLTEKDLQLNKDITEESRLYQRSDVLPWFWIVTTGQTDIRQEGEPNY